MAQSIFDKSIPDLKAIAELRQWGPGEPLNHRKLNEPVQAINKMVRGVTGARQIKFTEAPEGVVVVGRFKFISLREDYMLARETDGTQDGLAVIAIALPWWLRRTPFDDQQDPAPDSRNGKTYRYSSSDRRVAKIVSSGDTEVQVITDAYVAGDRIDAITPVLRGTGVTWTPPGEEESQPVVWLELNQGRGWAREA